MARARPNLIYAKPNVIAILNNFDEVVGDGKISLNSSVRAKGVNSSPIYGIKKYEAIKKNKNYISQSRKDKNNEWHKTNEKCFNAIIDVLYDHKDGSGDYLLKVWDNRALYAAEDALYFSLENQLQNNTKSSLQLPSLLEGKYRTFKVSMVPHIVKGKETYLVVCGLLEIEYHKGNNYLTTTETFEHNYDGIVHPYVYHGVINPIQDGSVLLWKDYSGDNNFSPRDTYLRTNSPFGANYFLAAGTMLFRLKEGIYTRNIIIDRDNNNLNMGNFQSFTAPINDKRIPEQYREILNDHPIKKSKDIFHST